MKRPRTPPPLEFFTARRPSPGDGAIELRLEGLSLFLEGLDPDLRSRLLDRYAPYAEPAETDPNSAEGSGKSSAGTSRVGPSGVAASARAGRPGAGAGTAGLARPGTASDAVLRVRLGLEGCDYFIDPPEVPENNPVLVAPDGARVRYLGYRLAGWFEARGGRGEILLARGAYEPDLRAIENYVRVATAWLAASLGGALVHAASAVRDGRGYLFFGPSGAGKSTLSAANTRARVVSDDLSLVLPRAGGGLDLIGSPFRGTYTGGPPVLGRFPLVHGFRIVKDTTAAVRHVPRVRAFAELIANLPFLVDSFPTKPELFAHFEGVFAQLPLAHLHFRKDDTYWDAIDRAGL